MLQLYNLGQVIVGDVFVAPNATIAGIIIFYFLRISFLR